MKVGDEIIAFAIGAVNGRPATDTERRLAQRFMEIVGFTDPVKNYRINFRADAVDEVCRVTGNALNRTLRGDECFLLACLFGTKSGQNLISQL